MSYAESGAERSDHFLEGTDGRPRHLLFWNLTNDKILKVERESKTVFTMRKSTPSSME